MAKYLKEAGLNTDGLDAQKGGERGVAAFTHVRSLATLRFENLLLL